MSGNMTKYQNGTGFISDENVEAGLGVFQTILLSFTVVSSLALVFSLVYFTLKKRALDELRHRLVPLYHFDPGECEDWEDELLEDSKKEILRNDHKIYEFFSLKTSQKERTDFYFLKDEGDQLQKPALLMSQQTLIYIAFLFTYRICKGFAFHGLWYPGGIYLKHLPFFRFDKLMTASCVVPLGHWH